LVQLAARRWSVTAFFRLIWDHLLCPAIGHLRRLIDDVESRWNIPDERLPGQTAPEAQRRRFSRGRQSTGFSERLG
jgi:hypothetical protein